MVPLTAVSKKAPWHTQPKYNFIKKFIIPWYDMLHKFRKYLDKQLCQERNLLHVFAHSCWWPYWFISPKTTKFLPLDVWFIFNFSLLDRDLGRGTVAKGHSQIHWLQWSEFKKIRPQNLDRLNKYLIVNMQARILNE